MSAQSVKEWSTPAGLLAVVAMLGYQAIQKSETPNGVNIGELSRTATRIEQAVNKIEGKLETDGARLIRVEYRLDGIQAVLDAHAKSLRELGGKP